MQEVSKISDDHVDYDFEVGGHALPPACVAVTIMPLGFRFDFLEGDSIDKVRATLGIGSKMGVLKENGKPVSKISQWSAQYTFEVIIMGRG